MQLNKGFQLSCDSSIPTLGIRLSATLEFKDRESFQTLTMFLTDQNFDHPDYPTPNYPTTQLPTNYPTTLNLTKIVILGQFRTLETGYKNSLVMVQQNNLLSLMKVLCRQVASVEHVRIHLNSTFTVVTTLLPISHKLEQIDQEIEPKSTRNLLDID